VLALCRDLDDAEWQQSSAAKGWRIQDVVAHLASGFHGVFTPEMLTLMRSKDIERTNDVFVDERREWAPAQTLAEYERWSGRVINVGAAVCRTPLAALRMPLGELGRQEQAEELPRRQHHGGRRRHRRRPRLPGVLGLLVELRRRAQSGDYLLGCEGLSERRRALRRPLALSRWSPR